MAGSNNLQIINSKAIVVFLRTPELGKVKTRLAKSLGKHRAFAIYQQLTAQTLSLTSQLESDTLLYFYPEIDPAIGDKLASFIQKGNDLGEKMADAFEKTLAHYNKVLLIGIDCPYITKEILEEAFQQLDTHDLVLGPSFDGGYYLIGMKQYYPRLFKNVAWSTSQVFTQTINKAQQYPLKIGQLKTLSDIDYERDWLDYQTYLEDIVKKA